MHQRPRSKTFRQMALSPQRRRSLSWTVTSLLASCALLAWGVANPAAKHEGSIEFDMVRSDGLPADCVSGARGHVVVDSKGPVEEMRVFVEGLPPKTEFDFFVIQKPGGPFGMSWYQGDIETNADGRGEGKFLGRFNIETFIVAPGSVPAPTPHGILDQQTPPGNPATKPVHTYHLGLWFNSPVDGANAGCPGGPTPFNGDHTAGIQVLNTHNFPDLAGPLSQLQ